VKKVLAALGACALLVVTAQAQGGADAGARAESVPAQAANWAEWTRPLAPNGRPAAAPVAAEAPASPVAIQPEAEVDVVDAHWMALTMWGEARNQGEIGMRAVGHVIANRRQAKTHGSFVTDTVSAAWQFSCWNKNDPNRAAMLAIEDLPRESEAWRQWQEARRLADDILSGRSADPTGGALFYHTTAVHPRWAEGVTPSKQIGAHLFYDSVG
jgi:spore germination cell wall hydrolase CwlJ-like protein